MGSEDCNDTSPSIYTSIGAFWDWILERIGEDPKVKLQICFLVSDRLEQEKAQQPSVEPPSADGEEGTKTLNTERPTDKETRKKQAEEQKIEKDRKRLTGLSKKELTKVAFTGKIVLNDRRRYRKRICP